MPTTVKQLRSFLGAFRAVSICIPNYSCYLSDLEDVIAGIESRDKIVWSETLKNQFFAAQKALCNPKVIVLPHPDDQLILISDGCNSPPGVGSTLFVKRGQKLYIGGFFSVKIKKYQLLWLPCEIEALCINLTIHAFSNLIRESKHTTKFLTDSKACVQAFVKLSNGGFSLSPRISSYLMNLNSLNVTIDHVKGADITLTDFCSRNPITCPGQNCQICQFVAERTDIAVQAVNVEDILNRRVKVPFYDLTTWTQAQRDDPDLRRTFSQLSSGTRPGKKEKDINDVRRYLQVATISSNGLLIHRKTNPYGRDYELIIVPQSFAPGLLAALHLRLGHPKKSQLRKVWDRYFYSLNSDRLFSSCYETCALCTALKTLPRELVKQSTTNNPDTIGKSFSADIIRREKQKIFLLIDSFSSFKVACFVSDEQKESLREALIQLSASLKHPDGCVIRADNASGFLSLKNDQVLNSLGITMELGRIKNSNHNPTIDKAVQEIEYEIKCLVPSGGPISTSVLVTAVCNSNSRVRANGLSSKEVLFKRDSCTNENIDFNDDDIAAFRYNKRLENHPYSEKSKSRGSNAPTDVVYNKGELVHLKKDGTKHLGRDFYTVVSVDYGKREAKIQKITNTQFRSKRYIVKFSELYRASSFNSGNNVNEEQYDSDNDAPLLNPTSSPMATADPPATSPVLRRSHRRRRQPDWLSTDEIERIDHS